jgi:uncharacterized protein YyaL (SSP411 family)
MELARHHHARQGRQCNAVGLCDAQRRKTEALLLKAYDKQHDGFGEIQRFIHGDTLAMAEAAMAPYRSKQVDENVAATRLLNLLARNTGRKDFREAAEHGMRYLIALADDDLVVPGALLADREFDHEPAHVTIVGAPAQAPYASARQYPTRYLRIEWLDRREGPLPAADVKYPELPEAAAFACANGTCSLPVFAPDGIARIVSKVDDR